MIAGQHSTENKLVVTWLLMDSTTKKLTHVTTRTFDEIQTVQVLGVSFSRNELKYENDAMVAKVYYATWPTDQGRQRMRGKTLTVNMEREKTEAHTYFFT